MSVNPRVSFLNTYDNIGRLTQAGSGSFSYDKAGNNQNNNALYNLLNNQLKSSDLYTITYDAMGNITSKYNKLTKTTSNYTFNSRNQLINYRQTDENNQSTKTLTYTYDAFNRRVSKTEDGTEQRYLYDGDDIVAILDSNNAVIATITHDESIDTPLSITNANGTFYYHRDHQGSIVALTDSSGQVVESFTYDNHYGTIVNHTKTVETNNPYAYTGRELDTDELYYYRARYYDPTLERFIGEDPIGFASGDFNFYTYVSNDPINFIDPSGNSLVATVSLEVGYSLLALTPAGWVALGITAVTITCATAYVYYIDKYPTPDPYTSADPDFDPKRDGDPIKHPKTGEKGWEQDDGSIYVPERSKGNPHGGSAWKKWPNKRDWGKNRPREGTYDKDGTKLRK